MTSMEAGAWIASVVLAKASVIAIASIVVARFCRTASSASFALGAGLAASGLVALVIPWLPQIGPGLFSIRHEMVQDVSVGPVSVSITGTFVLLWAIGATLLLGRLVLDLSAAFAVARRARGHTDRRVNQLLHEAARAIGLKRVPELRETSDLASAALIGFYTPVLLLPRQARQWSEDEVFAVFCHELEHARRHDWLMLVLERVVTTFFWINPLVHLVRRSAAAAREVAADDAAIRSGAAASLYANRLIAVARAVDNEPRMAVSVAFAAGGTVDSRVRALFESRDRRAVTHSTAFRAAFLAVPLIVVLATVNPFTCLPRIAPASEACP